MKNIRIPELLVVAMVVVLLNSVFYLTLKSYYGRKFSEENKEKMIVSTSVYKEITDDPCKWSVIGDPDAKDSYIKLNIFCDDGGYLFHAQCDIFCDDGKSLNTLDLRAIKKTTIADVLHEFSRMQGIDNLIINEAGEIVSWGKYTNSENKSWSCKIDIFKVNLNDEAVPKSNIDCVFENNL